MDNQIQMFSFKGSIIIAVGVLALNVIVVNFLVSQGMSMTVATTLVNGLVSPLVIAYVTVYIDGTKEKKLFIKRYVLFGLLFSVTCILWGMGLFI
jgi:hypothetical protein